MPTGPTRKTSSSTSCWGTPPRRRQRCARAQWMPEPRRGHAQGGPSPRSRFSPTGWTRRTGCGNIIIFNFFVETVPRECHPARQGVAPRAAPWQRPAQERAACHGRAERPGRAGWIHHRGQRGKEESLRVSRHQRAASAQRGRAAPPVPQRHDRAAHTMADSGHCVPGRCAQRHRARGQGAARDARRQNLRMRRRGRVHTVDRAGRRCGRAGTRRGSARVPALCRAGTARDSEPAHSVGGADGGLQVWRWSRRPHPAFNPEHRAAGPCGPGCPVADQFDNGWCSGDVDLADHCRSDDSRGFSKSHMSTGTPHQRLLELSPVPHGQWDRDCSVHPTACQRRGFFVPQPPTSTSAFV
eukprot:m.362598 g.362598  ORF g.362598 m.362598 type:complete len:355 (+) comp28064_c1_seq4:898-1962(+)